MTATKRDIDAAALDWLVRVNDPAFEAWHAWDAWMAADARHASAYWRLAEDEAEIAEALRFTPRPSTQSRRPSRPSRASTLPRRTAIAAVLALLAVGGGLWATQILRPQPWLVETAPGEQRSITLADGTVVSLDGATRLALDRRQPRDVSVEAGRALFEVIHDDTHPFRVTVGGAVLTDLGTTFDVTRLRDGARVAVSEGQVRVEAGGATATLDPGDSVVATPAGLERGTLAPEDVAGWREGRLAYAGERLAVVAQDLARILQRPVAAAPSLADRRFSGSLTAASASDRARLEALLDVTIDDDGEGWRLEPRRRP